MPVENKPGGKAHAKSNKDGQHVRRKGPKADVNIILMEDIIEAEPVRDNIQRRAGPAAGCITKGLQRHQAAERRIEVINKRNDAIFHKGQRYLQKTKKPATCLTFAAN